MNTWLLFFLVWVAVVVGLVAFVSLFRMGYGRIVWRRDIRQKDYWRERTRI